MASLETRIAKMEAKAGGKERGAVVALYEDETREEALARVDPELYTMTIFVRRFETKPEDGEARGGLINTFGIV